MQPAQVPIPLIVRTQYPEAAAASLQCNTAVCGTAPRDDVGLTTEEREAAIARAADAMDRHYAAFAAGGRMVDLERAHRALVLKKQLEAGRTGPAAPAGTGAA